MLKFRECEKETKTKAFSKEGLKQPSKQTPQDVRIVVMVFSRKSAKRFRITFARRSMSW